MEIIPAIDLLEGKVVRLSQGKRESAKVYSDKPIEIAKKFLNEEADRLHIVDLDAAFGTGNNLEVIKGIAKQAGGRIQVGGGIRTIKDGEKLSASGVDRIIIGTTALDLEKLWDFALEFGEKVWVACDVKDGIVYAKGWKEKTEVKVIDFLSELDGLGIGGVVLTDISGDGMLKGASMDFFREAKSAIDLPIIASGGISSVEDVVQLKKIGFNGAIVGKAIYENKISVKELTKMMKNVK
ncbi:MAG: 1-(5-phosphoribosyl)-5-[(5-phosphoribosylamino)methylideneamino]imidazole-4-carboxamide isomerase [Candidatus Micrarchaeota archaeon]